MAREYHRWTEVEEAVVRDLYPRHGASWEGWEDALGWRPTKAQVSGRARALGVRTRRRALVTVVRPSDAPPPTSDQRRALGLVVTRLCSALGVSSHDVVCWVAGMYEEGWI